MLRLADVFPEFGGASQEDAQISDPIGEMPTDGEAVVEPCESWLYCFQLIAHQMVGREEHVGGGALNQQIQGDPLVGLLEQMFVHREGGRRRDGIPHGRQLRFRLRFGTPRWPIGLKRIGLATALRRGRVRIDIRLPHRSFGNGLRFGGGGEFNVLRKLGSHGALPGVVGDCLVHSNSRAARVTWKSRAKLLKGLQGAKIGPC